MVANYEVSFNYLLEERISMELSASDRVGSRKIWSPKFLCISWDLLNKKCTRALESMFWWTAQGNACCLGVGVLYNYKKKKVVSVTHTNTLQYSVSLNVNCCCINYSCLFCKDCVSLCCHTCESTGFSSSDTHLPAILILIIFCSRNIYITAEILRGSDCILKNKSISVEMLPWCCLALSFASVKQMLFLSKL